MGRLHCVAHLGRDARRRRGLDPRDAAAGARGGGLEDRAVTERIQRLAEDFPVDAGLGALVTMRDELNESAEGRATTKGLADRMVEVSGGLGPQVGDWVKAAAGRKHQPAVLAAAVRPLVRRAGPAVRVGTDGAGREARARRSGRCCSSHGCRWQPSRRAWCCWSSPGSSTAPPYASSPPCWPERYSRSPRCSAWSPGTSGARGGGSRPGSRRRMPEISPASRNR